jgi:peptide/nickel transport system substrate-binding protein
MLVFAATSMAGTSHAWSSPGMGTVALQVQSRDFGVPNLTENFNPLVPSSLAGVTFLYEPLYVVNSLTGAQTPWLATSYKWLSATNLVFTLRSGVKWSDGTPFTAADVAYTFNLMQRYPALDPNGVWSSLASAAASGNTVAFRFKTPNVPDWYYIATTPIVNQAQWSTVKNPVVFTNPNPVVTGPFVVKAFTPLVYKLAANPLYWQRSKVLVPEIDIAAVSSTTINQEWLAQGKFDWAGDFMPDQNHTYIARDPKHYFSWQPYTTPWTLYLNLTQWPFNQVPFRQALAYAIDRTRIVQNAEYDYMLPAYQSLIPPALQTKWTDPALTKQYAYSYNPTRAAQLLAGMGLKKNGQGQLLGTDGKPLSFTLLVPTGWVDIIQACQFVAQDLSKLGITVQVQTPAWPTVNNDVRTGNFQMVDLQANGFADPYFIYNAQLSGQITAPIGQLAASNWERWKDPATDQLLQTYARTTDSAKQQQIMFQLQKIMLAQAPVVTLDYGVWWNHYTTLHYTGFPNASNPYAASSPWAWPDSLLVVTHLTPVSQ